MVHQTNQNMCYTNLLRTNREKAAHNTSLAKLAVQCVADTFVVNQTLVLCVNTCGENRHLRQARTVGKNRHLHGA